MRRPNDLGQNGVRRSRGATKELASSPDLGPKPPSPCASERSRVACTALRRPAGVETKEFHGSALPILRKNPHDRSPDQPCAQRDEPKVAPEPACGARRRQWSYPARARLHPLYPVRKTRETRRKGGSQSLAVPSPRPPVPASYSLSPALGVIESTVDISVSAPPAGWSRYC